MNEQQTQTAEAGGDSLRLRQSDSIGALAKSLCRAQSQVEGAAKDSQNPHFKSKYADLASVWLACRSALTGNSLSVVQSPAYAKGHVLVTTRLIHDSGEWLEGTLAIPVGKSDAHGIGSATTYARRYALAAMVGVAPEDDDGNAAAAARRQSQERAASRGQQRRSEVQRGDSGEFAQWLEPPALARDDDTHGWWLQAVKAVMRHIGAQSRPVARTVFEWLTPGDPFDIDAVTREPAKAKECWETLVAKSDSVPFERMVSEANRYVEKAGATT